MTFPINSITFYLPSSQNSYSYTSSSYLSYYPLLQHSPNSNLDLPPSKQDFKSNFSHFNQYTITKIQLNSDYY